MPRRQRFEPFRPIVEDDFEAPTSSDDEVVVRERVSDQAATERSRAYRCPSHGRSRTASVEYVDDDWVITGVCCDRAIAAVRAELDG